MRVLAIGDTHFPFQDNRVLDRIYDAIKELKPQAIVQLGDLYDFYSASAFPGSRDFMTPKQEFEEGRKGAEDMWRWIRKIAPKASLFQLWGNHDARPRKRVTELLPSLAHFFRIEEALKFDGVTTLNDDKDVLELDGVAYMHGHRKFASHFKELMMPTVTGHLHRGAVHFENVRHRLLWELNAGYCGYGEHAVFDYYHTRLKPWTPGYGVVDERGPRFCPVILETPKTKPR
jgi:predicted phosphodiesterase